MLFSKGCNVKKVLLKKAKTSKQDDRATLIVLADNYVAGGVDVVTFQLLNHYARVDCKLVFITNWNNPTLDRIKENEVSNFKVIRFRFFLTKSLLQSENSLIRRVLLYLLEVLLFPWYVLRFSLVLNNFPTATTLCINGGYPGSILIRAATVATKWFGRSGFCVLAVHNIALSSRRITRPIENIIDRLVFKSVDALIGVSTTCLSSLAIRPLSRKVIDQHVIRNSIMASVMMDQVKVPFSPNSGAVCFFMPCTYEHRKGHHIALEAFKQFLASGQDGSLIFAGGDSAEYRLVVQEMVNALGLAKKVTVLEHQQEITHLYDICDVVLAPYLGPESFCLTVLEGIAAGRPVIASSIEAITELYGHCPAVILVQPDDSQGLCSAMMNTELLNASLNSFNSQEVSTFLLKFNSASMFNEYDRVLGVNL
jgi:glycosyltransferase involved in cell wall biosynthesis